MTVQTRLEWEWVSHDLKENKVECPLKSNEDTRIFVWQSQNGNGDAHVWHSHEDKGEGTWGFYVTFTQRRMGQFHSEKRQKGVAVHVK